MGYETLTVTRMDGQRLFIPMGPRKQEEVWNSVPNDHGMLQIYSYLFYLIIIFIIIIIIVISMFVGLKRTEANSECKGFFAAVICSLFSVEAACGRWGIVAIPVP